MRTFFASSLLGLLALPAHAEQVRPAPSPSPEVRPALPSSTPSPAPKPSPPPVLEGTVRGPDGKPVADALVGARLAAGGPQDVAIAGRTDAGGAFRLSVGRLSLYTLRIEARGLAARTLEKVRPGAPLAITLDKGGFIQGSVRDGTTGQPVAGVRVRAAEDRPTAAFFAGEPGAGRVETTADGAGRFRIEGLAPGLYAVAASGRGYGRARKASVRVGSAVELFLFPGSSVRGMVRGPGDQPVPGAVVRAEADSIRPGAAVAPEGTDAEGRFELSGLAPGTYRVIAFKRGLAPGTASGIVVERSGDVEVDLALETGTRVQGRLVGAGGGGVAGQVALRELEGAPVRFLGELLRADAGADGRFALDTVPPGAHTLVVTAPGYAAQRVEVDVGRADRQLDLGEVLLETGLTIRGRVRDKAGTPIADATIRGFQPRPSSIGFPEARSEADGSFLLAGLEAGNVRLSAAAPGYGSANKSAEAGAENVELVLQAAGTITGLVVDEADRPVEAYQVSARPSRQDAMIMTAPRSKSVAAGDGRFVLEDVAEGSYVVQVTAPERAAGIVSDVRVSGGGAVDVGRIRLGGGGIVRGTVVDAGGAPVPGASVSVRGPGRDVFVGREGASAETDPGGSFELRGVPAGAGEAVASHASFAEGRVGIDVDPTKGPTEARIVLTQGGRVEGFVRRRDGSAVTGTYVQVSPVSRGVFLSSPSMIPVGPDGSFVAEHVPAGRTAVMLMNRSGERFTSGQTREIDVREGQVTVVEFQSRDILVSGRVTRSGAPYPNLRLRATGTSGLTMMFAMGSGMAPAPGGPQRMGALTREDGSYEMLVEQPGKVRISADTVDGRIRYSGREVEIPDADAHTLDLDFSGLTVTGVVVDKDTEVPVADASVFASPKDPKAGLASSSATSGGDGRFQLELDPGDYRLSARAQGYGTATAEASVTSGGAPEVRLAVSRGFSLAGRVVDAGGRPVGGLRVTASAGEPGPASSFGSAMSLPDGSFEIAGLDARRYSVVAWSDLGSFAFQPGVTPGDQDLVLTLKRGGRIALRVFGPGDAPVEGVFASVSRIGGLRISGIGSFSRTDGQGRVEVLAPSGEIEISANKDKLAGKATVTVPEGGTVPLEIRIGPATVQPGEERREERRIIGDAVSPPRQSS